MNTPIRYVGILIVLTVSSALMAGHDQNREGWMSLFNGKDFHGWKTFLAHRNTKDTGFVDQNLKGVIQIVDGSIHLYKDSPEAAVVPEGFLYTEKEYRNFHLKLDFRWGKKIFAQRSGKKRNSGILFHAQDTAGFWPTSIECQVMEGDVGDIYTQPKADR